MENPDQILSTIARNHLSIETLETRRSDSLDFHNIAVWAVRDALAAAYEAGHENATRKLVPSGDIKASLAAPDMLEALEAQEMAEWDPEAARRKGYFDRARELRRAALAKAKGGAA